MEFLEQEHISPALLDGVRAYRAQYPAEPALQGRIPQPRYHYYGKEVWEAAIAALLCGENLLLAGSKATGKNGWPKIWRRPSAAPRGTFPSTSAWTPPDSSAWTPLKTDR